MDLMLGLIGIAVFLVLLLLGVHVAVALAGVGFLGLALLTDFNKALMFAARTFYSEGSNYSFAVIPLFIVMGYFATSGGIIDKAFKLTSTWFSNIKGGLYWVGIASCTLFGAATGSGSAATISVGKILYPQMVDEGYTKKLSLGCLAASGTIGVLIPPSIPLVLYGTVVEENIGSLLLAGIIPGLLEAFIYGLGLYFIIKFKPSLAFTEDHKHIERTFTFKEKLRTLPGAWGIALLMFIIIGGIYGGISTPNEAGAIGALVALIMLIVKNKKDSLKRIKEDAWETAGSTAMLFFLIVGSVVFSNFLTFSGVFDAARFLKDFPPLVALIIFCAIFFLMGMFMSSAAALLIIAPLAHMIITPAYSGIWLGIIMVKMFEIGAITPPIGFGVFIAKTLDKTVPLEEVFSGAVLFWILDLITLAILIIFPQLVLLIPNLAS